MSHVLWLPLLANVVLAAAGPRLGLRLPPRHAVRLLTLAMLVTATSSGFALAVLGLFALAQQPVVAALAHWSPATVRAVQPAPRGFTVAAGVVVLVLLASAVGRCLAGGRDLLRAASVCRRLGPRGQTLVVLEDPEPDAYALPGVSGRVIVSKGMLDALPIEERRVLLAHEAAHLDRRHHLFLYLAEIAAAANPVLRPTVSAVRYAVEREADEAAAMEVGDRRLAARALARAAVARAGARRARSASTAAAVPGADGFAVQRATALLAPPPPTRRPLAAALVLLVAMTLAGSAVTARQTDARFERAELGPRSSSGSR